MYNKGSHYIEKGFASLVALDQKCFLKRRNGQFCAHFLNFSDFNVVSMQHVMGFRARAR